MRVWKGGEGGDAVTRTFQATARGLREMTGWLSDREVTAAAMEATGIYWEAPLDALEAAVRAMAATSTLAIMMKKEFFRGSASAR